MRWFLNFGLVLAMGAATTAYAAGGSGCSNPSAQEGKIIYNQDYHVYQYCDGDDWVSMAAAIRYVAGGDPPADCPNVGDVCTDGSVYAGLIGSDPLYVARCDAGMSWTGSCTGGRASLYWNSGTTNYTATNTVDLSDGQANTATIITIDADSVTAGMQQHAAAQYCADLIVHGQGDWYLPATNELNILYGNKAAIGGFGTGEYWSSTEWTNGSAARAVSFSDGGTAGRTKEKTYAVRCVRR